MRLTSEDVLYNLIDEMYEKRLINAEKWVELMIKIQNKEREIMSSNVSDDEIFEIEKIVNPTLIKDNFNRFFDKEERKNAIKEAKYNHFCDEYYDELLGEKYE